MAQAIIAGCVILIILVILFQRVYIRFRRGDFPTVEVGFTLFALQFSVINDDDLKRFKNFRLSDLLPLIKNRRLLIRNGKLSFSFKNTPFGGRLCFEFSSRLYILIIFAIRALYYKLKLWLKRGLTNV